MTGEEWNTNPRTRVKWGQAESNDAWNPILRDDAMTVDNDHFWIWMLGPDATDTFWLEPREATWVDESWHAPLRSLDECDLILTGLTWQWWAWQWADVSCTDAELTEPYLTMIRLINACESLSTWLSWISMIELICELLTAELHRCWRWWWLWSPDVDHRRLDHETWCLLRWECWWWADLHGWWCRLLIKTIKMRWTDESFNEEWRFDRELRDWMLELFLLTRLILKEDCDQVWVKLDHQTVDPFIESCSPMTDDTAERWADILVADADWFIVEDMILHERWRWSWSS